MAALPGGHDEEVQDLDGPPKLTVFHDLKEVELEASKVVTLLILFQLHTAPQTQTLHG